MVKDSLIKEGNFAEIERLTREAVAIMHGFEIVHVGINCQNAEEMKKTRKRFAGSFCLPLMCDPKRFLPAQSSRSWKHPISAKTDHIAIGCNFPDRAKAYLERLGVEFNESTATYDDKGNLKIVYLKEEIGGFAFHLVKK